MSTTTAARKYYRKNRAKRLVQMREYERTPGRRAAMFLERADVE